MQTSSHKLSCQNWAILVWEKKKNLGRDERSSMAAALKRQAPSSLNNTRTDEIFIPLSIWTHNTVIGAHAQTHLLWRPGCISIPPSPLSLRGGQMGGDAPPGRAAGFHGQCSRRFPAAFPCRGPRGSEWRLRVWLGFKSREMNVP